jgi:hypothetical protein
MRLLLCNDRTAHFPNGVEASPRGAVSCTTLPGLNRRLPPYAPHGAHR